MTIYKAPPGLFDLWPTPSSKEAWCHSGLWHRVEEQMRHQAYLFGFGEIRTPLIEQQELFCRSVGDSSDLVSKEMYLFEDRGGRKLALRPEGTAAVMRAVIEHQLYQSGLTDKLFYIGPMFRYERAQAGRYRQHHQFGVEAIGSSAPEQDVEVMALLLSTLSAIGLEKMVLQINSLGAEETRFRYRQELVSHFQRHRQQLSSDSQRRLEQNPLRILDSKEACDAPMIAEAPKISAFLSPEERAHFDQLLSLLQDLEIPYLHNERLVRGLDYYNGVVFEVTSSLLGAQNSLGGGGRYDGLLHKLGGANLPSVGFGCGIERVIQALLAQQKEPIELDSLLLYLIPIGDEARRVAFSLLDRLRHAGFSAQMDFTNRKLAKQLQRADGLAVRYVVLIGEEELQQRCCQLKEMATGLRQTVPLDQLIPFLQEAGASKDRF